MEESAEEELFEDIPKGSVKIAQKFIFRFAFLAKLKLRTKKANKNLHDRKMRILELIDG